MNIETKDLEERQVQLTVEIPNERLQAAMRSTARRLSRETRIPGFRPGKAPYHIVINKFGEDAVFDETMDNLGQEIYRQALDQSELEPYGPGSLDEIISRDPLVLRYIVPLPPEVDLGDYQAMRIPFEEPNVTDEDVEALLEELRQRQALIEPADRPAQVTDVVVINIHGELREPPDGEDSTLLDNKGVEVLIDEDTNWPVPGVSEHLIGLEAGSECNFEYTFPQDYAAENLRTLTADFHITCLDVKSRFIPEWSDDLAKSIGDYEGLLDLRIKVRESLLERAQRETEAEYTQRVIETTVEGSTIFYPPTLLQEELDEMLAEFEQRLKGQKLSIEDYLKIEKKTEEDLRNEFQPRARERLTRALVLGKLVEIEKLEVGEDEVNAEVDRIVTPFQDQSEEIRKAFNNPIGRRRITLDLLSNKAVKRLIAIARDEVDAAEEPSEVHESQSSPDEGNLEKE